MRTADVIAATRSGICRKCKGTSVMQPADVTKFKLCDGRIAGYTADGWEGWKCSACGNEAAIGIDKEKAS